jgi:hypothetical protein
MTLFNFYINLELRNKVVKIILKVIKIKILAQIFKIAQPAMDTLELVHVMQ